MTPKIPIVDGHTYCRGCHQSLPVSAFDVRTDRKRAGQIMYPCRVCRKQYQAQWYAANRDKISLTSARWRAANRDEIKDRELRTVYGIGREEYDALLAKQGGVCAICRQLESNPRIKHLAVDHSHATGKVRGFLCIRCNLALGELNDDPQLWRNALRYMTQAQAEGSE